MAQERGRPGAIGRARERGSPDALPCHPGSQNRDHTHKRTVVLPHEIVSSVEIEIINYDYDMIVLHTGTCIWIESMGCIQPDYGVVYSSPAAWCPRSEMPPNVSPTPAATPPVNTYRGCGLR